MALGATGGDEDEPATFLQYRGSQAPQIITLSRLGASGASAKGPRLEVRTSRTRQIGSRAALYSNAMCASGVGRARELSSGRGPLQSCARARLEWEPRSWDEQKPTRAPECNLSMPCSALNTPWPPGAASERTQLS